MRACGIDVFQVMDQLRQVFDRINVVVRRRRNQTDARNGVAHPRDHVVHFVGRAIDRLRRASHLRDFDLQFIRIDQVMAVTPKRPEATCLIELCRESPLAAARSGPRLRRLRRCSTAADTVHRNRERLVSFL